ncbi:PREDICTED: uncharacterized protein LOC105451111 [Wasmannia auropunctata]|uniref:uncharacterized protein LOC105451111 n=1 Tax=Wasmannia auropunctata TaxID=64793 RepID=UPI0005F021EE|nr:PREDICTED: uncharacterized protein LOC105451111 [Wasmannia auropunctata]
MEIIEGKKPGSTLYVYNNYTYNVDHRYSYLYRCSKRKTKKCSGRLRKEGEFYILEHFHNHLEEPYIVQIFNMKKEMVSLTQETTIPLKEIFDTVCRSNPAAAAHVSYNRMRSFLSRQRIKSEREKSGQEERDTQEQKPMDNKEDIVTSGAEHQNVKRVNQRRVNTNSKRARSSTPDQRQRDEQTDEDISEVPIDDNDRKSRLEGICVICLIKKACYVYVPCGHLCSCEDCANNLMYRRCPMCNLSYDNCIKTILSFT